ncbi:MAG TPA: Crp/Fnr family transcriptional regulator [Blastocatellia bacterium]|nr:Crp/Fnr family transcriptional regulator [Blastocatellia bacterium]
MPKDTMREVADHRVCQTLTGLTLDHLPRDRSLGKGRRYRKGADAWQPGDRADSIFFLRRGQVAVMTSDKEGREVIVRLIGAGEPFGELCFCARAGGLRQTFARAVVDCEAVEVKLTDFFSYLQKNRDAMTAFVFTFCMRLSEAEQRLEVLANRGAEERLGRLLLQLAASLDRTSGAETDEVTLHVSHDELAQMAAMSRSHVTVTMGKFRDRGLVRYERGFPLAVNVKSLTAYLEGESIHE